MEMINIAVGIIVGLVTSCIFWRFLLFLKPKVAISPMIARSATTATKYSIKVVNRSNRQVINLSARCTFEWKVPIPGGRKSKGTVIDLNTEAFPVLGKRSEIKDAFGINPVRIFVFTFDDLEQKLNDQSCIVFTLSATDAESGTTVIQSRQYQKDKVEVGEFKAGLKFQIIKNSENK